VAKDTYRYLLRMPQALRERLASSAASAGRSFNAEVLHRLSMSLENETGREKSIEGSHMSRRRLRWAVVTAAAFTAIAAALVVAMVTSGSSNARSVPKLAASAGDPDATAAQRQSAGGEAVTYEAYKAASKSYPAANIPLQWLQNADSTFSRIAARSPKAPPNPALTDVWQQYGPQVYATYPGLLDYGGAGYHAASRIVALAISNFCNANQCTIYAGPNGGGIWKTTNALDPDPTWTQMAVGDFAQTTVGDIIIDPTDITEQRIYVGTGEPNACSSGCPAGVGLYRSTNGGASFTKLADSCVSNATYTCTSPGKDSFIGRGISEIVVDPNNPAHLYVGSATAVRGLSHVIGLGGQRRFEEPGPNPTGLYESADGGATFTPAWVPNPGAQTPPASLSAAPGRRGVIDVGLDPNNTAVVYASSFDMGVWRRCPNAAVACGGEASSGQFDWKQVFSPRKPADGGSDVERTMFDLTIAPNNANKTRIYLTTGRGSTTAPAAGESSSGFWRTDNANQTAAALLATEPAPPAAGPVGLPPFGSAGAIYNGWQSLTTPSTSSPYWATHNLCTSQCWYDQDVMTPKNPLRPDEVWVIGSYNYGEMTCRTRGTNFCASGISNTRGILFSNTAGDVDPAFGNRTFTDMTWDATNNPASWCAYPGISTCDVAEDAGHPDQHEIVVNPSNPNQFFEASDGGMLRSNGGLTNLSRACDFRAQPNAGIPGLSGNALTTCRRLLSRVPTTLDHPNKGLGSTLQFINVAANPTNPCQMIGGTQDNGTWMPGPANSGCDSDEWFTKIYGDGGNAGFDSHPDDPALPPSSRTGNTWVFNQFTSPTIDANFRNGNTPDWVVISAPIATTEAVGFYQPQIADPNPPLFGSARTHPIFAGQLHVFRSWAFGAGRPISTPQQVVPDIPYYEANCPEFFTAFNQAGCGDFQPLGGPAGANQPGDLTGTTYGSDRVTVATLGRGISWIARRGADFNTMWATTGAGRVFVTFNANATDPAAVVWYRVDNLPTTGGNPCAPPVPAPSGPKAAAPTEPNCSPDRYPSGIYPDPVNINVAYVTYSGYNSATPETPGHVYRVILTRDGAGVPTNAAFNNLNVEMGANNYPNPSATGDLPANDVVMDDLTRNLYVATDFGVLKGTPSSASTTTSTYTWATTAGMPRYEVVHLALVGGQRDACRSDLPAAANVCGDLLLAATHSQGIWVNHLG
jgi:hypothetical protein